MLLYRRMWKLSFSDTKYSIYLFGLYSRGAQFKTLVNKFHLTTCVRNPYFYVICVVKNGSYVGGNSLS